MFPASSSAWTSNFSPLEVLITRASNPTMGEPNYALHLEVADYINQKKANTYVPYFLSIETSQLIRTPFAHPEMQPPRSGDDHRAAR